MAIESFWSPFDGVNVSAGNQMFLVVEKGGHVKCFWKAFNEGFQNKCHKPTFCGN
jgi:hypothetical protein